MAAAEEALKQTGALQRRVLNGETLSPEDLSNFDTLMGNVGAVIYLTVLSMVSYEIFFLVIAATAVVGFIALLAMEEPKGHMAEIKDDGTVELINVG